MDDGSTAECDHVLVALGRQLNTDAIGLETIGLEPGSTLEVDEHCQVPGKPWLYAIGDVNRKALLTHMGKYQARIAADHILGKPAAMLPLVDGPPPPRVVFSDPQVAAVGHHAERRGGRAPGPRGRRGDERQRRGIVLRNNAPGRTQILVDKDRKVIVGATFVGADVADFLHAATIAVVDEVPLDRLWHAVPSFPIRLRALAQAAREVRDVKPGLTIRLR